MQPVRDGPAEVLRASSELALPLRPPLHVRARSGLSVHEGAHNVPAASSRIVCGHGWPDSRPLAAGSLPCPVDHSSTARSVRLSSAVCAGCAPRRDNVCDRHRCCRSAPIGKENKEPTNRIGGDAGEPEFEANAGAISAAKTAEVAAAAIKQR